LGKGDNLNGWLSNRRNLPVLRSHWLCLGAVTNIRVLHKPTHIAGDMFNRLAQILGRILIRMRSSLWLLVDHSAFHHERDVFQHADVGGRIAGHGDDVGIKAGFKLAEVFLLAQDACIDGGGGEQDTGG
jgi:hypothetical protein